MEPTAKNRTGRNTASQPRLAARIQTMALPLALFVHGASVNAPSTVLTAALDCGNWCANNAKDWATKCNWGQGAGPCSGCAECFVSPPSPPSPPPGCTLGGTLYVSNTGSDANSGCLESTPLASINACASKAGAGGTCLVLPGTYSETVGVVDGVSGLTIKAGPAGGVTVDGTISLNGLSWETLTDAAGTTYYKSAAPLATAAWQLFANSEQLTSARWPNAPIWSDLAWSRDSGWAATDKTQSVCGHTVDTGTNTGNTLAGTGKSFDGCNVIINNEHWVTRRYVVANHTTGSSSFDYEYDPDDHSLCDKYSVDEH
eukprot:3800712-Prymnesium_polylepis.1